jgi:hypothetical protein
VSESIETVVLVLLKEEVCEVSGIASCCMTYIPRFLKIGGGIQAIPRFCLSNQRGCNVGITDGKDL